MKKYLIALTLVLTLVLGGFSQAKAATFEDLVKEVANLKAQITYLSGQLTAAVLSGAIDSAKLITESTATTNLSKTATTYSSTAITSKIDSGSTGGATIATSGATTPAGYFLCTDPGSSSSCCYVNGAGGERVYGNISDGPNGYFCNLAIAKNPNTNGEIKSTVTQSTVDTKANTQVEVKPTSWITSTAGEAKSTSGIFPVTTTNSSGFIETKATTFSGSSAEGVTRIYVAPIKKGDSGSDVTKFQKYLIEKGFLPSDTTLGFYGSMTTEAVKAFQKANGIDGDGINVGPKTLAVINGNTDASARAGASGSGPVQGAGGPQPIGCSITSAPSIRVLTPNGGQVFSAGQVISVKWSSCNIPATNPYVAILLQFYDNNGTQITSNGLSVFTVNDGQENVTLPATLPPVQGVAWGTHFKVSVGAVVGNNSVLDYSDNLFTINNGGTTTACASAIALAKNPAYANQNVLPSTTNVKIGSYIVTNNCNEKIKLTSAQVQFGATATTISPSGNLSNLKVYINGVQQGPTMPVTTTNIVALGNSFIFAPGQTALFEIYADIGSVPSGVIQTALILNGKGMTSGVNYTSNTALGQILTIANQTACSFNYPINEGIFMSASSTASQYIAAGTTTGVTDAAKATFGFTSNCPSAFITELGFKDGDAMNALTRVKVGSITAPVVSNKAFLTGLNIAIPNGGAGVNVDAFTSYAPVGVTGIPTTTTGDISSLLKFSYIKYSIGGTVYTMCANGDSPNGGSCTWPAISMPIAAKRMTVVGSKPLVSANQPQNSVLTLGENEAIDITVTADVNGPVKLYGIPFNTTLSASSGSPLFGTSPIVVKDSSNSNVTVQQVSCTAATVCSNKIVFPNGYILNAGQSQTFKLYLPIQALGTGSLPNTYLATSIPSLQYNGFQWMDIAGGATMASGNAANSASNWIYNYPSTFTSTIHN